MLVPVSSSTRNPKGGILADFVFEMIEEKKGGIESGPMLLLIVLRISSDV